MENIINTIIERYGILGVLLVVVLAMGYVIYKDKHSSWSSSVEKIDSKIDNLSERIELVKEKVDSQIDDIEDKLTKITEKNHASIQEDAKIQTINILNSGYGGKLAKILRYYCKHIGCDHIFLGSFHNGTTDLRGIHYCKFDIIMDEFKDPLHIHPNDIDFQSLYKDENIVAYGDLPFAITHTEGVVFDVNEEGSLLDLSDTIYRRCKSRDIKQIGFVNLIDCDSSIPIGFIGCVSYDEVINLDELKACAHEIENIYNI